MQGSTPLQCIVIVFPAAFLWYACHMQNQYTTPGPQTQQETRASVPFFPTPGPR